MNISIIGLGLIGGSIAKGLKGHDHSFRIYAFDKADVLDKALGQKIIDDKLNSIEESINSEIIFLCLPLEHSLSTFEKIIPILKDDSILTDVCGIKGAFEKQWNENKNKGLYIGGHPMTGKEKGGFDNSDPLLFENAVYILSDSNKESPNTQKLVDVLKLLGSRITFLNPFLHDKVVARVSHLPQLLSVGLVNSTTKGFENINPLDFAAGGFRDMTRIASSDFNIWKEVLKLNKLEILSALNSLQNEIDDIRRYLINDSSDKLNSMFNSASEKRDEIPKNTKGFVSPLYDVFVFVNDVPGIISRLSTALFNARINIKDIELLKIREGSGGTFRLSFESANDVHRAKEILVNNGFKIN